MQAAEIDIIWSSIVSVTRPASPVPRGALFQRAQLGAPLGKPRNTAPGACRGTTSSTPARSMATGARDNAQDEPQREHHHVEQHRLLEPLRVEICITTYATITYVNCSPSHSDSTAELPQHIASSTLAPPRPSCPAGGGPAARFLRGCSRSFLAVEPIVDEVHTAREQAERTRRSPSGYQPSWTILREQQRHHQHAVLRPLLGRKRLQRPAGSDMPGWRPIQCQRPTP